MRLGFFDADFDAHVEIAKAELRKLGITLNSGRAAPPRQVAVGPGVMGQNRSYNGRANSFRAAASAPHSIALAMSSNSAAHKRSWILSSGSTGRSRSSRQRFASSRYFFGVFMVSLTFIPPVAAAFVLKAVYASVLGEKVVIWTPQPTLFPRRKLDREPALRRRQPEELPSPSRKEIAGLGRQGRPRPGASVDGQPRHQLKRGDAS